MFDRLFSWTEENSNKDTFGISLLKFVYSFIKPEFVAVTNIILPFIVTVLAYYCLLKLYLAAIVFVILIICNFCCYVFEKYRLKQYSDRRYSSSVLHETLLVNDAITEYMAENGLNGHGIFEFASSLVCTSIYQFIKSDLRIESRISVVQQIPNDNSNNCKMVGRASKNKKQPIKAKEKKVEYIDSKKSYYYMKLFIDNEPDCYVMVDTEISDNFKTTHKKQKIYQYICITQRSYGDDIAFLLQIDGMKKDAFGDNKNGILDFADAYMQPYVSILVNAYETERHLTRSAS